MILVTGASGLVGRQLVPRLHAEGLPVRAYVLPARGERPPRMDWPDEVEVVAGRLDDAQSLYRAMQGVHTVIHRASAQWWGTRHDLRRVDIEGATPDCRCPLSAHRALDHPEPAWCGAVLGL